MDDTVRGVPKTVWRHVRPTPTQMEKAAQLGIQVSPDDTFSEVASRILEEVGDAIGCPPRGISDSQYELAEELGLTYQTASHYGSLLSESRKQYNLLTLMQSGK